jgi:bifunctional ADP-heptose synthase (sugar kinase/adenylyltransferase)
MKIYVLGDYGLDNYLIGKVRGISAEVPIPVVTVQGKYTLPAMAGNVAANLTSLAPPGVEVIKLRASGATTSTACPVKNRLVVEGGHQIARWDENDTCDAYSVGDLVPLMHADAIVVADYGKGSVTPDLVKLLAGCAAPIFVDTKADPTPWIGSKAILFPNLAEYRQFEEQYQWIERVVLKLGAQGVAYMEFGQVLLTRPSKAAFVQCVNGAGDTVLAAFTLAALSGVPVTDCLAFSQAAAALVVEGDVLQRTTTLDAILGRCEAPAEEPELLEAPGYTYHYVIPDGPVN